jgi:hypothetical protein
MIWNDSIEVHDDVERDRRVDAVEALNAEESAANQLFRGRRESRTSRPDHDGGQNIIVEGSRALHNKIESRTCTTMPKSLDSSRVA